MLALLLLLAACPSIDEPPVDSTPSPTPSVAGPGLGNVAWDAADVWTPVGWVNNDNGVPPPDTPELENKPYGTNVAGMHDGYLFTLFAPDSGGGDGGLLWYDVSDPTDPQLIHRIHDERTAGFREAHSMGFGEVDGRRIVVFHTGLGVEFWDITSPFDAAPIGRLDLPGVDFGDYEFVSWQLAWQGPHVYVASSERGVFVVDATDPSNPTLADRGLGRPNPVPPGELGGFRVGPIFAVGNLLILSSMDTEGGYAVADISDPANPALLSALTSGFSKFYATCFGGNRIVGSVRGSEAEMTVHDISDPFRIESVHTGPHIPLQLYCSLQDDFVFQGNEEDWAKVDVSEPTAPVVVGTGVFGIEGADHGQVMPFGNLLWVGNDHGTGSAFFPHQAEPDTTAPRVTMVSPADGDVAQALTSRIGFTFSDAVLPEWLGGITVRPEGGEAISGRVTVWASTVNFAPDEPLEAGRTYQVEVEGVRDFAGNPMAAPFTSSFLTTTAVPGPGDEPLVVTIDTTDPVPVGSDVTLSATVTGAEDWELRWSVDGAFTAPSTSPTIEARFDDIEHAPIIVRATDGARVATHSVVLTVHPAASDPPPRSNTLALDGDRLWVANPDQGTVTEVDRAALSVVVEHVACEEPRSVAVADAGVLVACEDGLAVLDPTDGTVLQTLDFGHGARPFGVVAADSIWLTLEGGEELVELDADLNELRRIALGPSPRGLSVTTDRVYVSRFLSPDHEGQVWSVDRGTGDVSTISLRLDDSTVDAEDRARGLPNYLGAPSISPDGSALWVPSKTDNILRGLVRDGTELDHESAVRAVTSVVTLPDEVEDEDARLDFNDRALPIDVAFTPLGDYALVVLLASNGVEIVDAYDGAMVGALAATGSAPRSVLVEGDRAYVHGWLSRRVSVYDLKDLLANRSFGPPRLASLDLVTTDALSEDVLAGKRTFTNARDTRMSRDGYVSCAVCHLDGGHDGRTWDFTDRGEGLRNTHDLRARAGMGHGPLHWTANFDEVQDFENDIRGPFGGTGFMEDEDWATGTRSDPLGDPKAGLSEQLDRMAAYVSSLDSAAPSPHRLADGLMTAEAEAGGLLFADLGCGGCHAGAEYTDSGAELYDVGTITPDSGLRRGEELTGFDPPTLRGAHASPPYLHDGSAATVRDVFVGRNPADLHGATSPLSESALDELEAFLLSLE